jgi:ribonucleoside-diphosphate reductase alpha chain
VGEEAFERLGVTKEARAERGFSLLKHLGFTHDEIDRAGDVIIGRMTIEGAPYLDEAHYPVFDCANRCGKTGQRYLAPMSHVWMMASTQPFLCGAISKTVNLPHDATVDDVAKVYEEGWRLGLKAVALYRDGCKASQPLSTSSKDADAKVAEPSAVSTEVPPAPLSAGNPELSPIPKTSAPQDQMQLTLQMPDGRRPHGLRVRLPKKRTGFTQEARVGGHKIFLRTGEYEDGTLGEIFIDMHKEGAAFRSLMNCFAMSVSIGLQYGVPLETYVEQFTFTRFEPQGLVEGHPYVKLGTSIVDYLFRVLGVEYLHRYDLAHVRPDEHPTQSAMEQNSPRVPAPYPSDPRGLAHTKEAVVRSAVMSEGLEGQGAAALLAERAGSTPAPEARAGGAPHRGGEGASALDAHLDAMMGDAPVLNCGNSMGCS